MFKKAKVSASIYATDWQNENALKQSVLELEKAQVDFVHFDVCDGKFVEQTTFDYILLKKLKTFTTLGLDVHLMVQDPQMVVEEYIKQKPSILTIHFEAMNDKSKLVDLLKQIKMAGIRSGLSICPTTNLAEITPLLKENEEQCFLDLVLVMSVVPGKSGQKFIEGSEDRIRAISEFKNIIVEVDGGVTEKNAKKLRNAGADILVSGSTIFASNNMTKTVKKLKGGFLI